MPTAEFMCLDGEIVPYRDARIHAFSGVVKYGCGVFEGIRAYWNETERELFVFRLPEHIERLRQGMKLMRYAEVYPSNYLAACVLRMLRANDLRENVHIRVIAYLGGDDELAQTGPVGLIAGALPRGSPKGGKPPRFVTPAVSVAINAAWRSGGGPCCNSSSATWMFCNHSCAS